MSAPHEDAQPATEATGDAETSAGTEGGRDDLRALLALKAAAFRWTASRRPTDGSLLADAARGLLVENERLREERDQAIAHDRQPYPTQWAYDQACAALEKQRERAEAAEAERDQLKVAAQAETRAATRWMAEANQAEAAIARVRALVHANADRTDCGAGWLLDSAAVLAALYQDEEAVTIVRRTITEVLDLNPDGSGFGDPSDVEADELAATLNRSDLPAVREFAADFDPRGEPPCPTI